MAIALIAHEDHLTLHVDGSIVGRIMWNNDDRVWEFKHNRSNFVIHASTFDKIREMVRKWIDDGMII